MPSIFQITFGLVEKTYNALCNIQSNQVSDQDTIITDERNRGTRHEINTLHTCIRPWITTLLALDVTN